ncbi:hypothetical protein [Actinoplanes derwentensis]|nr:hypothetical protein [Actinoplanes derwentensis]GID87311.1 hypothetical protein Ade03nite_62350 [Actinoplanes derwentensis]
MKHLTTDSTRPPRRLAATMVFLAIALVGPTGLAVGLRMADGASYLVTAEGDDCVNEWNSTTSSYLPCDNP